MHPDRRFAPSGHRLRIVPAHLSAGTLRFARPTNCLSLWQAGEGKENKRDQIDASRRITA
jgi:hypothetical protein